VANPITLWLRSSNAYRVEESHSSTVRPVVSHNATATFRLPDRSYITQRKAPKNLHDMSQV